MYLYGHSTNQDINQALFWYRKAAIQGNEKAAKKLVEIEANPLSADQQRIGAFIVQEGLAIHQTTKLTWLRFSHGQTWKNDALSGSVKLACQKDTLTIVEQFNIQGGYMGFYDWRVPNYNELKTLIDTIRGKPERYIDDEVFPDNQNLYWSDSFVFFSFPELDSYESTDGSELMAVRLVRGKELINPFGKHVRVFNN